jgi:acyl-CoA dehydrogenase
MGAALDLSPFVWSSVGAATMLVEGEPSDLGDRLLASLVEGAVVGLAYVGRRGQLRPLQGTETDERLRIPHGEDSTWVLVPRSDPAGGLRLVVIETARLETRMTNEPRSDLQMLTETTMAELCGAEIGSVAMSLDGWVRAACVTRLALAAYALGAERRLVELASDYARSRQQFGKPIGFFQAVAHRCVDMHVRAEADAVLVDYAAWQVARTGGDSLSDRLSRLAKARTLSGAAAAAASALQVFAGHGFAMDGDVQRFFRRTQGLSVTWGSAPAEFDSLTEGHTEASL